MQTFNINAITFVGVDDKPLSNTDLSKVIGNALFERAITVPVHDAAKRIYKGESFTVTPEELQELKEAINAIPFFMYIKAPLLNYISTLQ